jgi:hypothetical protein
MKPDFDKYNRQLAVMCRLHLRGGEVAIINQFAEDYAKQEAIELRGKIENLSVRYYSSEVNMTPELMKEKILEIINQKFKDDET